MTMQDAGRVAAAIREERLWADLQALARLGESADGGVCRLALDDNDVEARLWLAQQGESLGCVVRVDPVGNVFLRLPGSDPDLPPVATGSHLDSQPTGGKYDGAYGVVAAVEVLRAFRDAGVQPRRSLEVVAWTNEEGVRFTPGTSGSACFAGVRSLQEVRASTDAQGTTFGAALDACLARLGAEGIETGSLGSPMHSFVELHIEQGPVLEQAGAPSGVVTGIQGVSWFEFDVRGVANHAGTTPHASRRDAFEGATRLAAELRKVARDEADLVRFTIGRFQVQPGAVNTIPERVIFSVDLRHPETATLNCLEDTFRALASRNWAGCSVAMTRLSRIDPVAFPATLTETISNAAEALSMTAPRLVSGAFHDAIHLAGHCPTGMIFIPCRAGISHHPAESILSRDAVAGARLLGATLARLAA